MNSNSSKIIGWPFAISKFTFLLAVKSNVYSLKSFPLETVCSTPLIFSLESFLLLKARTFTFTFLTFFKNTKLKIPSFLPVPDFK